jgi:hypothetical protein
MSDGSRRAFLRLLAARGRAVGVVGAAVALAALGVTASAAAQPPTTEAINVSWTVTGLAQGPPLRLTAAGTFGASGAISDSGTGALAGQSVANPSPIVGILQYSSITLTGQAGTLTLRCNSRSTDFSDPTAVPGSGPCAITGGTGTYAGLHGQGTLSSVSNLVALTEVDTISLNVV